MMQREDLNPPQARARGMTPRRYLHVLGRSFRAYDAHHGAGLAAAMSFYAVLSLAPLIVLLLSIAGVMLDRQAVARHLVADVESMVGDEAAEVTAMIVEHANQPAPGRITMIFGFIAILFGATRMFTLLQDALNIIWEVRVAPGHGVWHLLRKWATALVMVVIVGAILLVSPLLTTAVTVINGHLVGRVPQIARLWQLLHLLASIVIITLMFAAVFKILPYIKIQWSDVWVGAATTALMFTAGQFVIGTYLAYSSIGSAYGVAGSLVVFLVWVYYSSVILFLGAEFTQVFARQYGSHADRTRVSVAGARPHGGASAGHDAGGG